MGVIQRQAIKNNTVAAIAVMVGVFSNLIVFPEDKELQGYIAAVAKWALLLAPFITLGTNSAMVRFLPYLKGEDAISKNQLLVRALAMVTAVLAVVFTLNGLFGAALVKYLVSNGWRIGVWEDSRWVILGILGALSFGTVFTTHLSNARRIAVPVVFNNLLLKVGTPLLFVGLLYGYLTDSMFRWLLVVLYACSAVGLFLYARSLGLLRLGWRPLILDGVTSAEVVRLAGYSILGALGSKLAVFTDTISVEALLGRYDTGVYTFALFIMTLVAVPFTAINSITTPIIAAAWKKRDMAQLGFLYQETSLVLFAIGALIYAGALVCLPHLYEVNDKLSGYRAGYLAVVFLGGGQLADMATSINGGLLGMSDHYRWNVYLISILGLLNVVLNYLFIATFGLGIVGAAVATMVSLFVFNVLKAIAVYWKMGLQPFAFGHLYVSLTLTVTGLVAWQMPVPDLPILAILVKGLVVTVPFLALLRFTNSVPPVRRLMKGGLKDLFR